MRSPATNTGLAKGAVQCSADTFTNNCINLLGIDEPFGGVDNQCLVLRIKICGENPPFAKRQSFMFVKLTTDLNHILNSSQKTPTAKVFFKNSTRISYWLNDLPE